MSIAPEIVQGQPRYSPGPIDTSRYGNVARLAMPDTTEGMAFKALTPIGQTLTVDTGEAAAGPEPLELLLVALGSCAGMDVISILRKKRQSVTHYSVNVYAHRAEEHPRIYTEILVEHVVVGRGVDPKAVARSIELSITRYCPVHALLSRAIPVEHVYRVLEEEVAG